MKIKITELSGEALDWAVADATGHPVYINAMGQLEDMSPGAEGLYKPSTDWEWGGPIIDRELISLRFNPIYKYWEALNDSQSFLTGKHGPTALIAAMRCYVASKLGPEVEVPEVLL